MLNFLLFTSVLATRTERATSTPTLAPTITTRAASDQVDRQTDKRMNWYMDLDNGKKVLLGSNSSATMTVASVDVLSLGSYSDPKEHSVIAKWYEHFLFLLNATLPEEGEYETPLTSAGGGSHSRAQNASPLGASGCRE